MIWRRKSSVFGEVAQLRFSMEFSRRIPSEYANSAQDPDFLMLTELESHRAELEAEINKEAAQTLGHAFEVKDMRMRRGSVEVLVVIGTTYAIIAQYAEFVRSIDLLVTQVRKILRRFAEDRRMPYETYGTWQPGVTLAQLQQSRVDAPMDANMILLLYLLLSHAALMGVLIWSVVRGR